MGGKVSATDASENPSLAANYNARYGLTSIFNLSVRTYDKEYQTIPDYPH
jgi:hypothetical protein